MAGFGADVFERMTMARTAQVVSLDAAEPLAGYRYDGKQVQVLLELAD